MSFDKCPDHHPVYIGFRAAPYESWLEIAHPYMRRTFRYFKCFACGERVQITRPGEPMVRDFDRVRRSSAAEESPRKSSRTVINT